MYLALYCDQLKIAFNKLLKNEDFEHTVFLDSLSDFESSFSVAYNIVKLQAFDVWYIVSHLLAQFSSL